MKQSGASREKSIYNYQSSGQCRLVTRIDGEAPANCPTFSQEVTYQPNNLVSCRTNWKGNKRLTHTIRQVEKRLELRPLAVCNSV